MILQSPWSRAVDVAGVRTQLNIEKRDVIRWPGIAMARAFAICIIGMPGKTKLTCRKR